MKRRHYGRNGGVERHDVQNGRRHHVEEDTATDILLPIVGAAFVLSAVADSGFFNVEIVRRESPHVRRLDQLFDVAQGRRCRHHRNAVFEPFHLEFIRSVHLARHRKRESLPHLALHGVIQMNPLQKLIQFNKNTIKLSAILSLQND